MNMAKPSDHHAERERFFGGAKIMALLTLLSRLTGMLRAIAVTSLGASALTDAFAMAFKIPNLFRRLFGEGALSSAFVPVFTETLESDGEVPARRLLGNAAGLLGAALLAIMLLIEAGLLAWGLLWPGPEDRQLLIGLLAVMLPFMVTICLLALGSAALNCRGRFTFPAFAPVLLNLFMIAATWLVWPLLPGRLVARLYILAASVTLAGLVQVVVLALLLRREGLLPRLNLGPIQPGIRVMLHRMGPMLLGLGFLQLMELAESAIAWLLRARHDGDVLHLLGRELAKPLGAGVLIQLDAARYLYQLPLGVLAMSLSVAVFPLLSRYAARDDMPSLRDAVNRALRLSSLEALAAGTGLFVLAEPITLLLYRHGNFSAEAARSAAFILRMYVLGMWGYCTYPTVVRAFYALGDTTTPLKTSCVLALPHMLMVAGLVWAPRLGPGAFGLATALTFTADALALIWLLRRRLGRFGGRRFAASLARAAACAAAMAATLYLLRWQFHHWGLGHKAVVAAGLPVGAAVFLAAARLLRAPELGELLGSLRRRKTQERE